MVEFTTNSGRKVGRIQDFSRIGQLLADDSGFFYFELEPCFESHSVEDFDETYGL
jgi:hypothetical protein